MGEISNLSEKQQVFCTGDFLEVDKDAIKIMLNSRVGLGWNESQVRNFLAGASW